MINKDRKFFQYNTRYLVYIISPLTSQLHTALRKVMVKYVGAVVIYKVIDPHNYLLMKLDGKILRDVGPVVIYKIIDPHNCLLMTLDGKVLRGLFEHDRFLLSPDFCCQTSLYN